MIKKFDRRPETTPIGQTSKGLPMENQKNAYLKEIVPNWDYRRRSFGNLLRMGHCAPTAMQTLLDISSMEEQWLIKLSAGMPGGIGNTGFECGAFTSPLVLLGLQAGLGELSHGLPVIFDKAYDLGQYFLGCHKTLKCREIRGKDRFPYHCIAPVTRSPELYQAALDVIHLDTIPMVRRDNYSRLYAHWVENDFHCARAVLTRLDYSSSEHPQLLDAVSAFIGGTAFMGWTCSAFTAGVMAVGLKAGEIENSIPRVTWLLTLMTVGGNAFDERVNKFNRSMNRGYRMSKWFRDEFGSTQCQAITGCDFADAAGVSNYIEGRQVAKCRTIAGKVAEKVQEILA
jgi:hypothetical protein